VAVQDYFDGKPELQYYATLHGCIDSLKSGVTTVLNMEWATPLETIKVYEDTGIRAMHGLTITDNDKWTPPEAILPHDEYFALAEKLNERCKNSKDGRVVYWHAIACPNSNSTQMIKDVRDHANSHNIPIHIHLAETNFEFNNIQKLYGNTPTGYLKDIGLLGSDVSAAHSIWLTDDDIDLLKEYGVSVVHNPECNAKIASGVAPIAKMLNKGIAVGVGSDSVAVKDNHDLFQTMRVAAYLQRVHNLDSMAISSYQVLEMATLGGAKALKVGDKLGSLEPGKLADIILVDLKSSHMRPINNLINNIVYCATSDRVTDVIVNGKLVVENKKLLTVNEEEALAEAEEFAYKRYTAAGLNLPPYFCISKVGM
jgi:5-methylthioadenosine/S-adenosylhomocysteine deaminase